MSIFSKQGKKLDFLWCALVFCRENRRPKTAKFKIYLIFEGCRGFRCGSLFGAVVVSTCAGGAGCRASGVQRCVCSVPLSLPFVPLLLCSRCVGLKYGFIWLFKGVFSGFLLFRVCLLGSGALRGLWGFCVRVRLGGFGACGVFCLSFSSFLLLSSLFLLSSCSGPASLLGFCSWSLGLLVLWLLVFFPFRTASDTKRKGAKVLPLVSSLRVLWFPLLLFWFKS